MVIGDITIEDEHFLHARETKPTVCIDVEYGETEAIHTSIKTKHRR
tara:strand:- start:579 stop:716 length:138 start_codon:yes stop_codon:yes gene_type:complete